MVTEGADAAEGFYRLIRYEHRSLASNPHPSAFDQLIDRNLASALVDRLLHHVHVVVTDGDSNRLAAATGGKGIQPLNDKPDMGNPHDRSRGEPNGH
jgi:DNA replication protein DnaC